MLGVDKILVAASEVRALSKKANREPPELLPSPMLMPSLTALAMAAGSPLTKPRRPAAPPKLPTPMGTLFVLSSAGAATNSEENSLPILFDISAIIDSTNTWARRISNWRIMDFIRRTTSGPAVIINELVASSA